jgi:beta-xylosidase
MLRRRDLLAGAAAAGALGGCRTASPRLSAAPTRPTYLNPVLAGDRPDPSVIRVGEDFYMTHSSFNYAPGLLIWQSRDLVDWQPLTHALPAYDGDVWAPDLVRHDGRYFVYYPSNSYLHVVSAPDVRGPWSAPVNLGVRGIDPGHVVGPDGKRYLHFSGGRVIELGADGLAVVGEARKVFEPWPIPRDWAVECVCLESPKLYVRDGWYHLVVAQGGTAGPATSHMVVSARSRTPVGPWELSPHNPIVHTDSAAERWWSRGHGSLVDTPAGDWWILYHGYENGYYGLGRQTLMEPIEWTADGWFRVKEGSNPERPLARPLPGGAAPTPLRLSDDFGGPKLGWQWQFWGEHDTTRYAFDRGGLVLQGRGKTPETSGPLALVVPDHAYEAVVEVERLGDEGEAGVMLFYSPKAALGTGVNPAGVRSFIRGGDFSKAPATGRRFTLRLRNVHHQVTVEALDETGARVGTHMFATGASGFHHNTFGDFVSLRVALYASGGGAAVFRRFGYRALTG